MFEHCCKDTTFSLCYVKKSRKKFTSTKQRAKNNVQSPYIQYNTAVIQLRFHII